MRHRDSSLGKKERKTQPCPCVIDFLEKEETSQSFKVTHFYLSAGHCLKLEFAQRQRLSGERVTQFWGVGQKFSLETRDRESRASALGGTPCDKGLPGGSEELADNRKPLPGQGGPAWEGYSAHRTCRDAQRGGHLPTGKATLTFPEPPEWNEELCWGGRKE